jgi:iron complex transport system ATP-binding protein
VIEPVAIRLTDVVLRFDGATVLDHVSWRVAPHERWVLIGPNGAGKTSLLRIAALTQHPSSGSVEVLGNTLGRCDVRAVRERIAFSSPALAAALAPSMTAAEVVMTAKHAALAPWWHRYDQLDRQRARELLGRFDCDTLTEHTFVTLSAGERQRVLLARTLMREPELLLLDEPTAGLDVAGREQLVADLAALTVAASSPPVVLVTHHLEEVPPGFTHALALRSGRVVASGEVDQVLRDRVLSDCFGVGLRVARDAGGRYSARLA